MTTGGSRQKFDSFFQRHVAGIASYCRWRSRSLADAEDAVAEVFLIAWRRFGDVPAGDAARPWLYATARRVLANQARANARRRRLSEKLSAEPVTLGAEEDPRVGRVHDTLAALDPRDGLTPTEVAVGCTVHPSQCVYVCTGRDAASAPPTKPRPPPER